MSNYLEKRLKLLQKKAKVSTPTDSTLKDINSEIREIENEIKNLRRSPDNQAAMSEIADGQRTWRKEKSDFVSSSRQINMNIQRDACDQTGWALGGGETVDQNQHRTARIEPKSSDNQNVRLLRASSSIVAQLKPKTVEEHAELIKLSIRVLTDQDGEFVENQFSASAASRR